MAQCNLFYQYPITPILEGHVRNILICTEKDVERLQSQSSLRLREKIDQGHRDKLLRMRLKTELDALQKKMQKDSDVLNSHLKAIEDALLFTNDGEVNVETKADAQLIPKSPEKLEKFNQVAITPLDPFIRFTDDFRGEMINTFFNNAHMWNFTFGSWFYKLKRVFYNEPGLRRAFKLTNVDSLTISKELLAVTVNALEQATVYPIFGSEMSDLEAALCILAAFYSTYENSQIDERTTLVDVITLLPVIFRLLGSEITALKNVSPSGTYFGFNDPSCMKFFVPMRKGKHYAENTFGNHVLIKMLLGRGVMQKIPGEKISQNFDVEARLHGAIKNDVLVYWTYQLMRPKLGNNVPIFIHDQHYLRSGLVAIESLFLLWRILNSESLFNKRVGKFLLTSVFPQLENVDFAENNFEAGNIQNFEYLMHHYVVPMYNLQNDISISTLFPGLVAVCVNESVRLGWEHKCAGAPSDAVQVQSKENPFVEYIRAQMEQQADVAILEKHDCILFHLENGLNITLSFTLPRQRLFAMASSLFNVNDTYDFIYFLVLGFLPIPAVI
uniref:DNA packaging tegument protein UL25 n=1 Tax=Human betaherpesvirus 6A TaxID=32603 RepID=A0A219Y1B6_9BETA|nr:DNA packaging tegument protein UL25 [Human betaherpesvirus 6A]